MLGIRWTIGDVSERGFEALRLSLWAARRLFGASAAYQVLVNTISIAQARERTGPHPPDIAWQRADALLPDWLRDRFCAADLAGGMAWKLAPIRCFPDAHELALDNDVILWEQPQAMRAWLEREDAVLLVSLPSSVGRRHATPAFVDCRPTSTTRPGCWPPSTSIRGCSTWRPTTSKACRWLRCNARASRSWSAWRM